MINANAETSPVMAVSKLTGLLRKGALTELGFPPGKEIHPKTLEYLRKVIKIDELFAD